MGRIRFQFWRDAVRDIYEEGRASENPVSSELLRAVQKHQVTRIFRMSTQSSVDTAHTSVARPHVGCTRGLLQTHRAQNLVVLFSLFSDG